MAIKRSENTFLGEGQIYSVGSPAWEPIPDWQNVLDLQLNDAALNRILNEGGTRKPSTGTRLSTKLPVGLSGARRGGIFKSVSIIPSILQRSTRSVQEINVGWPLPPEIFIPKIGVSSVPVVPKTILQPRVSISPPTSVGGLTKPTNINAKGPIMALDLGTLITGLGTTYLENKYRQPEIQQVFNPFSSAAEYLGFSGVADDPSMAQVAGVPKGYYIDCHGKLRKKARRRRRRLATPSDIKDLAALSAVTTPAEKKAWIATHPS